MTRARLLPALGLLLAAIVLPLYAFKVAGKADYTDFDVYFRAALRAKHAAWSQIYNLGDGASPFRYAPPFVLLLRPLAALTKPQAQLLWYFIQYAAFAAGFFLLARALRRLRRRQPSAWIVAAALIFILRFCLDCFTIGQTSSLMFLGFCGAFAAYVTGRPGWLGFALFWPAFFKIGPAFLFGLPAASPRLSMRTRPFVAALGGLAALAAALWAWVPAGVARELWAGWIEIVANDSVYYDASHYGSQSVKSALLRLARSGRISVPTAQHLWVLAALAGCGAVLALWFLRKPRRAQGRAAFFALGIFPYLWFMPETFKYSLTALAIPALVLWSVPRAAPGRDLRRVALALGYLTLSFGGLDLVGTKLFFWLQRASVPLFAYSLMAAAVAHLAWRSSVWRLPAAPMPEPEFQTPAPHAEIAFSVLLPVRLGPGPAPRSVLEAHLAYFARLEPAFELVVAPFATYPAVAHPAYAELAAALAARPGTRLLEPRASRAEAVRAAYFASRGHQVACAHAEQPAAPEFFGEARALLASSSAQAVWANRRHPETRFLIPVRYLPLVHGRYLMAQAFNRLVRRLLPVATTDTHSGTWLMSRRAATLVFGLQRTTGFLADLEAHLILAAQGLEVRDLPVRLQMREEKARERIWTELVLIARELPTLVRRHRRGEYLPLALPTRMTADDWGWTPGINQGILRLAHAGIVRRVSLMAEGDHLLAGLAELKQVPGIELGLHFNLTQGKRPPGRVLRAWLTARGPARAALIERTRADLRAQLARLQNAGVRPAYLDGHHHVHLVPGLLAAIAPVLREAGIRRVRLPWDPQLLATSKLPLALLSALAWRSWKRLGLERLECFYPQARHFHDPGLLRASLRGRPRTEVIVHPALRDDFAALGIEDSYTTQRVQEYRVLASLFPEAP